jgi:hypothetical protein
MFIQYMTSKHSETSNIKINAPHKLVQTKNDNECAFLMSMIREQCALGTGVAIPQKVESPVEKLVTEKLVVKVKQSCEDISLMLERCILDGHDCKSNFYKFKVLCKGDIDTKL